MRKRSDTVPEKFLDRLNQLYTGADLAAVLAGITRRPLPAFRTNTIKTTTKDVVQSLQKQGFVIQPVPWYADAFILMNQSIRAVTETKEYTQGHLYIQNLSSMIPALLLDPQPTETVLDLCAAPGSKTTQIATLMQNQGKIIANDLSRPRLYKLHANLTMYGVTNTMVANIPGQTLWEKYPETFDKALVDAPCTMEGRIRSDEPKTYQDWSLRKVKELATRQKYLLRSAVSATKVGGVIIYSTCTLAPEENEGVIDWLLKKTGTAIAITKIHIPGVPFIAGIPTWNKKFYDEQISNTARILPSETMEGFFVARIEKLASTITL